MALTEVNICNRALGRIGATAITSLDVEVDTSAEAAQCALHYTATRDALLRSHTWRFAVRWVDLVRDARADYGTATDAAATTLEDTDQAWDVDGYEDYYVRITGGTGVNQIRPIASNTADTLTVTGDWATTPDDTSTYDIWENYPPYPWVYQYDLPSDFLRFARTDPQHDLFEIAGVSLKSDEDSVNIEYVRQEDDPAVFDPLFVDVLVVALAVKLCMPLVRDKVMYRDLLVEQRTVLSEARVVNLQEAVVEPTGKTWNETRRGRWPT